jgi:hypothetical protein
MHYPSSIAISSNVPLVGGVIIRVVIITALEPRA